MDVLLCMHAWVYSKDTSYGHSIHVHIQIDGLIHWKNLVFNVENTRSIMIYA